MFERILNKFFEEIKMINIYSYIYIVVDIGGTVSFHARLKIKDLKNIELDNTITNTIEPLLMEFNDDLISCFTYYPERNEIEIEGFKEKEVFKLNGKDDDIFSQILEISTLISSLEKWEILRNNKSINRSYKENRE